MTGHHKRRSGRNGNGNGDSGGKSQNNISYLSFTAICQASAVFKSSVSDCRAGNSN